MSQYRTVSTINWIGLGYFYQKEVRKFTNIWIQTLLAPAISSLLFFSIFMLAVQRRAAYVGELQFEAFLVPGLIMMSVLQNSFINASSSIVIGKIQRNIVDTLMPPLSSMELGIGYVGAALTRGIMVGSAVTVTLSFVGPVSMQNPLLALYFLLSGSMMMACIGIMVGIWADKFDHQATISNFIIAPLTFLSGTFYSITALPQAVQKISLCNPFFYVINGLRYSFTGYTDGSILFGACYLAMINITLFTIVYFILKSGYKLKA